MPDQDPNAESAKRTLSEISHLFLSDVRDRHTGGAPRPQRVPPGQRPPAEPGDPVTPSRNTDAVPGPNSGFFSADDEAADHDAAPAPPVTAIIAAHFGGLQPARVRQYARHLAAQIGRVGLIEIDGADLRIACFELACDATDRHFDDAPFPESEVHDPRSLAEAIEELDWDVRHWLLAASNLRAPEIRSLMGSVGHWALLSTCDHDGVVASYRALKGLCDAVPGRRPLLTLSLLDAGSEPEMARVFAKLSGVCQQFLDWPVEPEPAIVPAPGVTEDPVLVFHPANPAVDVSGPWAVLADLVARANSAAGEPVACDSELRTELAAEAMLSAPSPRPAQPAPVRESGPASQPRPRPSVPGPTYTPVTDLPPEPAARAQASSPAPVSSAEEFVMNDQPRLAPTPAANPASNGIRISPDSIIPAEGDRTSSRAGTSEVLEISSEGSAESILAAILSRPESGLVECPVRTPMCPSARLTIDRDRRVILLAVAREGLAELRSIGQAYRWLIENRALIGMAVPQLAIDAHQFPRLHLLVDQADASADALQPMLQSGHVTVQAYRRLRWGDRTGLLLDAA